MVEQGMNKADYFNEQLPPDQSESSSNWTNRKFVVVNQRVLDFSQPIGWQNLVLIIKVLIMHSHLHYWVRSSCFTVILSFLNKVFFGQTTFCYLASQSTFEVMVFSQIRILGTCIIVIKCEYFVGAQSAPEPPT